MRVCVVCVCVIEQSVFLKTGVGSETVVLEGVTEANHFLPTPSGTEKASKWKPC